jgi:glucose-6-phosphate-specific signal transduction histidine kinase
VAGHDHAQTLLTHLHETPLQNIYAALTQLHLLENRLKYVSILPAGTFNALTQATSLLEACLDDLQKTYTSLHHPDLVSTPIAQLLHEMCIEHELLSGQVINLNASDAPLPACYKICLFYVCEMMLTHLRQEVNSSGIELMLTVDEATVVLEVQDTEDRLSSIASGKLKTHLATYTDALAGTWELALSETPQVVRLNLPRQHHLDT